MAQIRRHHSCNALLFSGLITGTSGQKIVDTEKPKIVDTEKPKIVDTEKPKIVDTEKPKIVAPTEKAKKTQRSNAEQRSYSQEFCVSPQNETDLVLFPAKSIFYRQNNHTLILCDYYIVLGLR
jgi:hypothetical protein